MQRYDEIDILKGIAITYVLLGHAIILYPINLHDIYWCHSLFKFVSFAHMPLFFLVSGFCCKSIIKTDYKEFLAKKVRRLIIPYIVFNFIDIFPRALLPQLINRPMELSDSIKRIIFYGGEFWFLYTLFAIFVIFPLIQKIIKSNKQWQIILGIIFLLLQFINIKVKIFRLDSIFHYILFFYIGYIIKFYFASLNIFYLKYIKNNLNILLLISLPLWIFISLIDYKSLFIKFIGTIFALICLFSLVFRINHYKYLGIFKKIGEFSLQFYLLNGSLLLISRTIFVNTLGITNSLFIILLNMLITQGLSYFIITKIFMKYKFLKLISGQIV